MCATRVVRCTLTFMVDLIQSTIVVQYMEDTGRWTSSLLWGMSQPMQLMMASTGALLARLEMTFSAARS